MMKNYNIIVSLIFLFLAFHVQAQKPTNNKEDVYNIEDLYEDDPYYWSYTKEVGINFTPLITKLIPFNFNSKENATIGLKWKKYYSKRAFRINFGANINETNIDTEDIEAYISFGIETRYPISKDKKLAYTSAYDVFLHAKESGGFGFSKGYGLEYHFTKRIFISTEAAFNLGFNPDIEVPIIEFRVPTAIFVNVRLY